MVCICAESHLDIKKDPNLLPLRCVEPLKKISQSGQRLLRLPGGLEGREIIPVTITDALIDAEAALQAGVLISYRALISMHA